MTAIYESVDQKVLSSQQLGSLFWIKKINLISLSLLMIRNLLISQIFWY